MDSILQDANTQKRFWAKVRKTDTCWLWTASLKKSGYGYFGARDLRNPDKWFTYIAHRFSYMLHVSLIPEGLCVCHSCDNRGCVNPDHLWLGTVQDNNKDRDEKGRNVSSAAILTPDDVIAIRALKGTMLAREIWALYPQVSFPTIEACLYNKTWRNVN